VLFTILSSLRWVEQSIKRERGISPKILEENITSLIMNGLVQINK
jgi:DNA-binding HxlR family transcriptional regulator